LIEGRKTRLSICIPTLNRASFIGATLESIVSQATDEVEILVMDGGSTDHTPQVVSGFQRRFPSLRYVRENSESAGLNPPTTSSAGCDRDCDRAVGLAEGEYCWLFADDDIVKPGAIERVLEATREGYGLIIVNGEYRSPDLARVLRPRLHRLNADRVYKPSESQSLFADVGEALSFLGCVVIKRRLWMARERVKYVGSGFIHVGVIFQSPLPEDVLVISERLISLRYGNALWGPRRFQIWMFDWPDLVWSFPHYSEWAKSQVCPREPWHSIKMLLLLRAEGSFSPNEYFRIEPYLRSKSERFVAKLIVLFPGSLLNFLGVVYCSLLHPASTLALVDLVNSPYYFRNWIPRVSRREARTW
jgi:glycosyltransferase involved in cell wall biosynthesis